jgi:hypothetical protein
MQYMKNHVQYIKIFVDNVPLPEVGPEGIRIGRTGKREGHSSAIPQVMPEDGADRRRAGKPAEQDPIPVGGIQAQGRLSDL